MHLPFKQVFCELFCEYQYNRVTRIVRVYYKQGCKKPWVFSNCPAHPGFIKKPSVKVGLMGFIVKSWVLL